MMRQFNLNPQNQEEFQKRMDELKKQLEQFENMNPEALENMKPEAFEKMKPEASERLPEAYKPEPSGDQEADAQEPIPQKPADSPPPQQAPPPNRYM